MRFWQSTAFTETEHLIEIARGAEAAGFEGVLMSEHLFVPRDFAPAYLYTESGMPDFDHTTPFPDPWVAMAAMAAATTKLRFCTIISILPLHHPLEVAKSLATLSVLSHERVMIGAGAGWMKEEFDALGVDFKSRGSRFDEMIVVMRKLWGGGLVEHHGKHFDFPLIAQVPAPRRPIPIAIGGASPVALRRAARLGDGWVGAGNTVDEAAEILQQLSRLRAEAGRAHEPFEAIVPLTVPATADSVKRLADLGADGMVNYPFVYTCGRGASLQQKLDMMKRYGDEMIRPMQGV